jgi:hypothetical protein
MGNILYFSKQQRKPNKMTQNMIKTFCLLLAIFFVSVASAKEIWVSPAGSDSNPGTKEKPFASVLVAQRQAREFRRINDPSVKGGIQIILQGGTYQLKEPLLFRPEDSGTLESPTTFRAEKDAHVVISGGVKVTGWQQIKGNLYKAPLDRDSKLRSLFVNGRRMHMAGTDVPVKGEGNWGSFPVHGSELWALGAGSAVDGVKFSSKDIQVYGNAEDVELVQFNVWTQKILCAREIEQMGDTTVIKLQQPYGAIATSMAWAGAINYEKSFVIRNAFELLDSPGEFYFNRKTQTLYYYSHGEDMATANVIAPTSDGLIHVKGESVNERVKHIHFEGITFSYDHWNLMEVAGSHGFAGIQSLGLAVKYVPDGNWHPSEYNTTDVPRGAIQIENAEGIKFIRNRFEGISSAVAINLVNDVKNSKVEGNYFNDLLGNAVSVGYPQHYLIGNEEIKPVEKATSLAVEKLPRNPVNKSKMQYYHAGIEGLCENIIVADNYIRNISLDFRQVEAITSFFVASTRIEHNDIEGTPYGAITCGWWWGNSGIPASKVAKNNSVSFNKAGNTHQVLDDGGIIYLLGEQPGTKVEGNYLFNGPRCIYPDDGSAYLTITRNVINNNSYKWMWLHLWTERCHDIVARDNYVINNLFMDNGTNTRIEKPHSFRDKAEFSGEALKIIDKAGIEEKFRDIIPKSEPEKISIFPKDFKERDVFN